MFKLKYKVTHILTGWCFYLELIWKWNLTSWGSEFLCNSQMIMSHRRQSCPGSTVHVHLNNSTGNRNLNPFNYVLYFSIVIHSLIPSPLIVRDVDNVSPNLTLSCSMDGEASFTWWWTDRNGNSPDQVVLSNATRTSTALFTRISSDEDGLLIFQCQSTYNPLPGQMFTAVASQDVNVELQCKKLLRLLWLYATKYALKDLTPESGRRWYIRQCCMPMHCYLCH